MRARLDPRLRAAILRDAGRALDRGGLAFAERLADLVRSALPPGRNVPEELRPLLSRADQTDADAYALAVRRIGRVLARWPEASPTERGQLAVVAVLAVSRPLPRTSVDIAIPRMGKYLREARQRGKAFDAERIVDILLRAAEIDRARLTRIKKTFSKRHERQDKRGV